MSRATPDDQLKFLLSCVRHSNNGKIDFVEVAQECGVVSKGAAAKRYERLLKANGIHPSGGPTERTSISTPKQKSKAEIAKSAAAKRRKLEGNAYDSQVDDEDEFEPFLKSEPMDKLQIKPEPNTGFSPYAFQHLPPSTQHPFFPTHSMTHMAMQTPFVPQGMPIYRPVQNRFVPPVPIYPRVKQETQPTHQSSGASVINQNPTNVQLTSTVSEDQIQFMFDEFCSQDLFKQPNYDINTSADTGMSTTNAAATASLSESQLSPGTVDSFATTSLGPPQKSICIKEESTTADTMNVLPEPTGKDIGDSILITD